MRTQVQTSVALLTALIVSAFTAQAVQAQPATFSFSAERSRYVSNLVRFKAIVRVSGMPSVVYQTDWEIVPQTRPLALRQTLQYCEFRTYVRRRGSKLYCEMKLRVNVKGTIYNLSRTRVLN